MKNDNKELANNLDDAVNNLQYRLLENMDLTKKVNPEYEDIMALKNLCYDYNLTLEDIHTMVTDSIENHDQHYQKLLFKKEVMCLIDKYVAKKYFQGKYTELNQLGELKEEVMQL